MRYTEDSWFKPRVDKARERAKELARFFNIEVNGKQRELEEYFCNRGTLKWGLDHNSTILLWRADEGLHESILGSNYRGRTGTIYKRTVTFSDIREFDEIERLALKIAFEQYLSCNLEIQTPGQLMQFS